MGITETVLVLRGNGMKVGKTKPINRIQIRGKDILDVSLDQGWEITNIDFDDRCPSSLIDELVVTFRKNGRLNNNVNVEVLDG